MTNEERETALAKFVQLRDEIGKLLETLQLLHNDHYNTNPENVTWGDVGSLQIVKTALTNILLHYQTM